MKNNNKPDRRFYLTYRNQQTVSIKISWSYYIDLLSVQEYKVAKFHQSSTNHSTIDSTINYTNHSTILLNKEILTIKEIVKALKDNCLIN